MIVSYDAFHKKCLYDIAGKGLGEKLLFIYVFSNVSANK
jgi:hypothetical protein